MEQKKNQKITIDILKAAKYMDGEQIASIYNTIIRETEKYNLSYNDNQDEIRRKNRAEFKENLQYNFARAILAKNIDKKLTAKEESEELSNICRDYFHEEPSKSLVDVSLIERRPQIMIKKSENKENIFGLDKLKKTFAQATIVYGMYANYDKSSIMVNNRQIEKQEGKKGIK